jgi:phage terminase large subunit-like protein
VTSPTRSSTPRLSEAARKLVIPDRVESSGWPAVRARCAGFGVTFDPWQDSLGTVALGKRADGVYAATVGGVVLSIPRQVGKTFLVVAMIVAMCLLFPGLRVLWTAHHGRTTTNTFRVMQGMCRRKKVEPVGSVCPYGER